jgi:hypothetical protein
VPWRKNVAAIDPDLKIRLEAPAEVALGDRVTGCLCGPDELPYIDDDGGVAPISAARALKAENENPGQQQYEIDQMFATLRYL